jgi:hypothetical protein
MHSSKAFKTLIDPGDAGTFFSIAGIGEKDVRYGP